MLHGFVLHVSAAPNDSYTIEINDSGAAGNREVIVEYANVGSDDVFEEQIQVINKTANAYAVNLKKIELAGDSGLLDKLAITLTGENGEITLTKADSDKTDWQSFCSVTENQIGNFILKTQIGELTNEHQGTSCAIRFFFDVVYLNTNFEPDEEIPRTGDNTPSVLYAVLFITSLFGLIVSCLNRRKRNRRKLI